MTSHDDQVVAPRYDKYFVSVKSEVEVVCVISFVIKRLLCSCRSVIFTSFNMSSHSEEKRMPLKDTFTSGRYLGKLVILTYRRKDKIASVEKDK